MSSIGTKIAVGGFIVLTTVGGVTAMAANNPTIQADVKSVQDAISGKNLDAYKKAQTKLINDLKQDHLDKVNSTTQDELNTMANRQAKDNAVNDAIKNNDYAAFKASAGQKLLAKIPDQASFDKLVTNYKTRQENFTKITKAIKNNDFTAFKAAINSNKETMPNEGKGGNKPAPTNAQLQTRFDKAVEAYKTDGNLPILDTSPRVKGMREGGIMGKGVPDGN